MMLVCWHKITGVIILTYLVNNGSGDVILSDPLPLFHQVGCFVYSVFLLLTCSLQQIFQSAK